MRKDPPKFGPKSLAGGAAKSGAPVGKPGAVPPAGAALPGRSVSAAPEFVAGERTGRVQFDDRGNAVWEWSIATGAFGREVSNERLQRLENPGLSLAEDAPTPFDYVKPNPLGTVKGYNPYDSGKLGKARSAPRKKDLKKLSEWLKLKKQAGAPKDDEE